MEGPTRGSNLTSLASLRFPDEIVRLRFDAGDYDDTGRWQSGDPVEAPMRASVQPVALEDVDNLGEGARLRQRLRVYVPSSSGELRAAADTAEADRVHVGGKVYTVEESRTWPDHTRAVLIRET